MSAVQSNTYGKLNRRQLLRLAGVGAASIALAACVAPAPAVALAASGGGGAAPSEEAVTLTIFDFGGEADQKVYSEAHARFNETHSNVTIVDNFTPVSTWSEYSNKIVTQVAGGQSPDIINIAIEGAKLLVSKGLLIPLDETMAGDPDSSELLDDVHPELIAPFIIEGKTWLIPHSWNNMVIYYNTKIFAEAGLEPPKADWTWNDFLEIATTLTTGSGDDKVFGFAIPNFNFGLHGWWLTNDTYQLNDEWTESNLDDPKMTEAVQFVHDLVHKHGVSPSVEGTDNGNLFVSGRVAMGGWGHWPIQGFYANDFQDFDVQLWPQNRVQKTVFGVGGWGISPQTPHAELSWELIRELTSKQTIQATADVGVAIPARRSVAESDAFLEKPGNAKIFYASLDNTRPVASPANFNELETIFMRHMGEVMSDAVTPEAGMAAAHEELSAAMARLQS
jgi:multiple sugar transport system substrate-binding protein